MLKPKIITLCGSTRFLNEFRELARNLTIAGNIVLSVELVTTSEKTIEHTDTRLKAKLDVLHFRKIDLSDEILVINKNGYIGESTYREICYAESIGVKVNYLEAVQNDNTNKKL